MYLISLRDVLLIMAASLFLLGITTFSLGVFVLVARAMGRDINAITTQAKKLALKGLAEDVAGLVGNTSALLSTLTQLVRTAAGIGVFLICLGLALMGTSLWIILQINWTA
jgi:hypothetical protein